MRPPSDGEPRADDPSGRRPRSTSRLILRLALLGVVLLVVVLAYQAVRVGLALREARTEATALADQVSAGDVVAARRTASSLAGHAHVARSHSDNLLWDGVAALPLVGHDVEAVQVVSQVLDDTSREALPPTLDLLETAQDASLRSKDGRFDLGQISRLAPVVRGVSQDVAAARQRLDRLDPDALLVPPLARATRQAQSRVADLAGFADAGAVATEVLPSMLGADGPRTYLLVAQNTAETRATGGLPGSLSLLRVRGGKPELVSTRGVDDFVVAPRPVLPLTRGELALYGPTLGEDVRDANLTPDFPRAAQLIAAQYTRRFGQRLDGVIAVDPVALATVLRATGPIQVGREEFTSEDVVRKLLSEAYSRFGDPIRQNAYFASAAAGVFDAFSSGQVEPRAVFTQLAEAGRQRRLLVWSRHPEEQADLAGTTVAGELPADTGRSPHVGLYLNDATAGKMEYYLDYTGALASTSCTAAGVQTLESRLVLASTAPRDARRLPTYVKGLNNGRVPPGWIAVNLRVYAPRGGAVVKVVANGATLPVRTVEHDGRPVAVVALLIRPQEHVDVTATLRGRAGQTGDAVLQWTPGIRQQRNGATAPTTCS